MGLVLFTHYIRFIYVIIRISITIFSLSMNDVRGFVKIAVLSL